MLKALHKGQTHFRRRLFATAASIDQLPQEKYLCQAFKAPSTSFLQDLINSLLLSECVYKYENHSDQQAVSALRQFQAQFPRQLVTLRRVQFCGSHVTHRYLLGTSETTIYAAFVGTKFPRDLLTDATFIEEVLWREKPLTSAVQSQASPAAHRGFLLRASSVPIEWLFHEAQSTNRKLILCGHSLGGAVAALSTLRLLKQLPTDSQPTVQCVCFGSPAVGNAALADLVAKSGWSPLFHSIALPGDIIPRLWTLQATPAEAEAVAEQLQAAEVDSDSPTAATEASSATEAVSDARQPWWQLPRWRTGQAPAQGVVPEGLHAEPHGLGNAALAEAADDSTNVEPRTSGQESKSASRTRLQQLQNMARTASTRLGAAGTRMGHAVRFWPGFVHFGHQHVWDAQPGQPLPVPTTLQSLRSTLTLAAHRMPAYRAQALLICSAAGALPDSSSTMPPGQAITAGEVVSTMSIEHARARMGPFPPVRPPVSGAMPEAPRWLPLLSRGAQAQQLQQAAQVHIKAAGQGLRGASSARVIVSGLPQGEHASAWILLPRPDPLATPRQLPDNLQQQPAGAFRSIASQLLLAMSGMFMGMQSQQEEESAVQPCLSFTVSVPEVIARQAVEHPYQHSITLHCRSDFGSCRMTAQAACPVAWLVPCHPSTSWKTRWQALSGYGRKQARPSESSVLQTVNKRHKVFHGIRLVHLDSVHMGDVRLPQGAHALRQRINRTAVGQQSALLDKSETALLQQRPEVLVIEHDVQVVLSERNRRDLAGLGIACQAAGIHLLVVLLCSTALQPLPAQAIKDSAALFSVDQQQVVLLHERIPLTDIFSDAHVSNASLNTLTVGCTQAQLCLFWLGLQGSVPKPAAAKL